MLRIAIVDKNTNETNKLHSFIDTYMNAGQICCAIDTFVCGLEFINNFHIKYDIVFLDFALPHLDGTDIALKLKKTDPAVQIIFLTNKVENAVEGYLADARGFLLQPVEYQSLQAIMDRTIIKCQTKEEYIIFGSNRDLNVIPVSSIFYVTETKNRLQYFTQNNIINVTGKINKAEKLLSGFNQFVKSADNCIVNLRNIKAITDNLIYISDTVLYLDNNYSKLFKNSTAL